MPFPRKEVRHVNYEARWRAWTATIEIAFGHPNRVNWADDAETAFWDRLAALEAKAEAEDAPPALAKRHQDLHRRMTLVVEATALALESPVTAAFIHDAFDAIDRFFQL